MSFTLKSGAGTDLANVNSNKELAVALNQDPAKAGIAMMFSQNDDGSKLGTKFALSPETDEDYRLRVALDHPLDAETFNYTSQNTSKHNYINTTMTAAWSTAGLQTNSGNVTTTATGLRVRTYGYFPLIGPGVLCGEFEGAFSGQPTANCIIDFGFFIDGGANPYTPTDGVYFRLDAAGLKAVINNNTTETEVLLNFNYDNNRVYQFLIVTHERSTQFWIDNVLYANVATPIGQGQPFMAGALPVALRHSHVGGAAGASINFLLKDYNVSIFGIAAADDLGTIGNRIFGSYQGLSGGTMGPLSTYANNTNPTAAVPSNTALTANLIAGLGGQAWETATLAVNTDGILMSYQVPAGTASVLGKRLKVTGVKLSSYVQTVLAGGPLNRTFTLNYGHTAVSLATSESASSKSRRVVLLPELTQVITANQAVNTMIAQPGGCVSLFPEPIYVNPGEFINIAVKHIGTVLSSGVIATNIQLIYSWE